MFTNTESTSTTMSRTAMKATNHAASDTWEKTKKRNRHVNDAFENTFRIGTDREDEHIP